MSGHAPALFFANLPIIFPYGQSLLFEGLEIGLAARSLYEEFPAHYRRKVACDTLCPEPEAFHVSFEADFTARLCAIISSRGMDAAFYHFKGYSSTELIFSFHSLSNSFDAEVVISETVDERSVIRFAEALGQRAEQAFFPEDHLKRMTDINAILNPPWWRRLLRMH